jgi:undecaprenol kinase
MKMTTKGDAAGRLSFLVSFQHASRGILVTWASERNFQIQTVAGVWVMVAAAWLHFEIWRWAVLLVVIGVVLAAELLNTAIEEVWEEASVSEGVKRSKDAAAGAVLVLAMMSVVVGLVLFWEPIARLF